MRNVLIASAALLVSGLATGGSAAAYDAQDRRGYGVSHSEAVWIARQNGVARITEIERDDGGWEIEGRGRAGREIEIEIDRRGRVTDIDRDDDDDDRRVYRGVSRDHAIGIAYRNGVARITEVKPEDDGGWEIEGRDRRGREVEIEIDRRGRVTDFERD